ncbi:alpha-L-fucosidase [Fulvivirgaceae bacterium BMA10]|uniref:alpha-L-fucosidase n=1 Tax=Splendidivirga corallicola TaxID=3051826 RepID=A0ABT8KUB4_9BACT|nr:alpha-L-fucosidase [Fulvivirgaceae bacterium BMA10]
MKKILTMLLWNMFIITTLGQAQNTIKINGDDTAEDIVLKAANVLPTSNQYAHKKLEFLGFIHFGPNTFTRLEWGNGMEDPKVFDLKNLDTDQWCRAMKDAGIRMVILTVKHHDGFVLWQSRYTKHGIMSTPFQEGKGDVLKDLSASCQKYGLKLGVYLSPADLYQIENSEGLYGNLSKYTERIIPRPVEGRPFENKTTFKFKVDDYNEYFLNQLFELLTEYGPIHEVWFDGAHPKRKGGQKYHYLAWKKLIRTLAPEAVIFGKEDVRWCGNEEGRTRKSEWDIIPFENDPNQMTHFPDLHGELGSREKLKNANYLHYLSTETNTSIREGWFYRDDHTQQVRSADDVFDIYERSVGGNSTFLLNIPPNRDGRFSEEDVMVLREVGQRIQETYGTDLLEGAQGNKEILDKNENSYVLVEEGKSSYIFTLSSPITANRFVLQEAIATESQRIEKHTLDAWVDGEWHQVSEGTTVGYKKILRFSPVTSTKFRIRILKARSKPSLSKVSAHYYRPRPSRLTINRSLEGLLTIETQKDEFNWKPHGEDIHKNLSSDFKIRYTTNGEEPNEDSQIYLKPFFHPSGEIKARAYDNGEAGSITTAIFGIIKKDWAITTNSNGEEKGESSYAIDGDPTTYWSSSSKMADSPTITVDLQESVDLTGFIYTPPTDYKEGLIEKGVIKVSQNGKKWKEVQTFELGNLINDPTPRIVKFDKTVETKYVQITSLRGAGGSTSATIAEIDFLTDH